MSGLVVAVLIVFAASKNRFMAACANACELNESVVRARTDAGWVCGRVRVAEGSVEYASFRGVPYGKPPIGERRFKELDPLDPWYECLDASEDSAACPQKNLIYGSIPLQPKGMSEDCIYLNLHVPLEALPEEQANCVEQKIGLPILVMIHGGAFHTGSGLTDLHGPEYLIWKNVMIITFNYRLGAFGFLSLGSPEVPGNQGLRDMVTLLRWVQRNARAFGGDPNNVTLMGQSTGAIATHILTLSQVTEGLFHKVIMLSGTAIPNPLTTSPRFARDIAARFLQLLEINSTDSKEIHRQLIELPLVDIMQANSIVQHELGFTSFVPVEEEAYPNVTRILDADPLKLIARGKEYPVLLGVTDKEEEFFRWPCISIDIMSRLENNPLAILSSRLMYNLPSEEQIKVADEVSQKYFNGTPSLNKYLVQLRYSFFLYPALKLAYWKGQTGTPVYFYKYTYRSQRSIIKEALWTPYEGAAHVEDLTYIFRVNSMMGDYISFPPQTDDDRMKDYMTGIVTNFMRCNTPTCSQDESEWPPITNNMAYHRLSGPTENQKTSDYGIMEPTPEEQDAVNFFDSIDEEIRNVGAQLESVSEST